MSKINSLSQCGFTIIEIMIAITVFAIGLIGINILQTTSIHGNSAASRISGRTSWATHQIEKLEQASYTTLIVGIEYSDNSTNGAYKATWTVDDNGTIPGTKKVTLTIKNTGNAKETEFTWIKARFQ